MPQACVYQFSFPNGKRYIGIAKNFERRWAVHKHMAISGKSSLAVHCAIRKYGVDLVKREILLIGRLDYVKLMEVSLIAAYNTQTPNGYNITPGGDGVVYTDEMRQQASVLQKALVTPEYREMRRAQAIGRKMTAEQNAKNSAAKKEHWQDPEYREKMAIAFKGRPPQTEGQKAKRAEALRRDWESGMRREILKKAMSGRKWINNGAEHKQILPGEEIPDGWIRGMLKRAA
jgi:group I intron endonuclease